MHCGVEQPSRLAMPSRRKFPMSLTRTLIATAALLAAGASFAQAPSPADASAQVIQRQANQQQRVDNGLKNGSLTLKEAGRIQRGEAALDRPLARGPAN